MPTNHQQHIFMPNEIFSDLRGSIQKSQHIAFAYTYYYFISHLYRYCEYEGKTQATIKEKLGYNPNEKRIDYLIKKDGVLDLMGYTQTTTDYPIEWNMTDGIIEFRTIGDFKKEHGTTIITDKNFKVKYPMKMFYRNTDSLEEGISDGILYDVSNTHRINYSVFEKCMSNSLLGVMAFYIYGLIKYRGEYKKSGRALSGELGISEPTLIKYTKEMESQRLLSIDHKKFMGIGGEANIYEALGS